MRTISGNYPEVWIGYKIIGVPGDNWFIVQDVHSVDLAADVFRKEPPRLPIGARARVRKVHYWMSPTKWQVVDLENIPKLRGFEWQSGQATSPSSKRTGA